MPPTPSPPRPPQGAGSNVLTRKLGPAPVWAYLVAVVGGYLLYRHFAGQAGQASAPTVTQPGTVNGSGQATDTGAPSGGGGTATDNFSADLFGNLLAGYEGIAGSLTDALENSQSVLGGIAGDLSDALTRESSAITTLVGSVNSPPPVTFLASNAAASAPAEPSGAESAPDPGDNSPPPAPRYHAPPAPGNNNGGTYTKSGSASAATAGQSGSYYQSGKGKYGKKPQY